MWRLWAWLKPAPKIQVYRLIDFTKTTKGHWAGFDGGDNNNAQFTICGDVQLGDEILVVLQSGRVGRYRLFSVRYDFTSIGRWKARGKAMGYWPSTAPVARASSPPARKIKGLLGDGSGWSQPGVSQLPAVSSGPVESAGELWKILVQDEASRGRTGAIRTGGHL